jgi:hypothetical protein
MVQKSNSKTQNTLLNTTNLVLLVDNIYISLNKMKSKQEAPLIVIGEICGVMMPL